MPNYGALRSASTPASRQMQAEPLQLFPIGQGTRELSTPGRAPPTRSTPETFGRCAALSVAMTSASPAGLHTPPTHT